MNMFEETKKWINLTESIYGDGDDEPFSSIEEVVEAIANIVDDCNDMEADEDTPVERITRWIKDCESQGLTCYNICYHDDNSEYNLISFKKQFLDEITNNDKFSNYSFEEIHQEDIKND